MKTVSRLARLPLSLIGPNRPRRILTGRLRGALWVPESSTHGCWLGTYERSVQRAAARLIRSGDSVFDIGANVGFHTLLFSRLVGPRGRVTAFEPLDRNLEYLSRHLQLNAAENVAVIPVALSDEPGRGFMDARGNPSMARLADDGRAVLVESLDHLIAANRVPIPQLLKIDVEGAESRVLRGASKTLVEHRPRIILAAHGWRQNDECRDTLLAHGYSIEEIRDGREDGNYELLAA